MATADPVVVSLRDLESGSVTHETLQAAFGPDSLGIIVVEDVPAEFADLRRRLLSYASYMGNLQPAELDTFTNPAAKYLVGWSRGREQLKTGGADEHKGSFYANCAFHAAGAGGPGEESRPPAASARFSPDDFPEYLAPNSWPREAALPGFRPALERMCALVIDVAALVARACDAFAARDLGPDAYPPGYLERVVRSSTTTKARLLHYYPVTGGGGAEAGSEGDGGEGEGEDEDSWCAAHKDHGCLTGLTSAMFVDEAVADARVPPPPASTEDLGGTTAAALPPLPELEGGSPDPRAGLWIRDRRGAAVQVRIPRGALAFQTGEALERITRGRFRAVEHEVRGSRPGLAPTVARNTLAVFTQPNLGDEVDLDAHLAFGDFARGIIAKNTV